MVGLDRGDGGERGDEIGHYVDGVDAAGGDGRGDGVHHGAVAEVHVEVGGGGEDEVVQES